MHRFILFMFLCSISIASQCQTAFPESYLKKVSDRFIYHRLGRSFVKSKIKFLFIQNHGLDVAVYELKKNRRADGKGVFLVHFKYLKSEVDTFRFDYTKKELTNCMRRDSCNMFIGLNKVKQIATDAGLRKGDRPWKINVMYLGKTQVPVWGIVSTDYDHIEGIGSGQSIEINMRDGSYKELCGTQSPKVKVS